MDEVLRPFGARFSSDAPFRPVNIRAIYEDEGSSTDAWFLTLSDGKGVDGTAFYDSIAFNELWDSVAP